MSSASDAHDESLEDELDFAEWTDGDTFLEQAAGNCAPPPASAAALAAARSVADLSASSVAAPAVGTDAARPEAGEGANEGDAAAQPMAVTPSKRISQHATGGGSNSRLLKDLPSVKGANEGAAAGSHAHAAAGPADVHAATEGRGGATAGDSCAESLGGTAHTPEPAPRLRGASAGGDSPFVRSDPRLSGSSP